MYEVDIDPISAPLSSPAPVAWSSLDPTTIEDLSDTELDELPFGVICLAGDGTILRYNLAEARLARLDRARVLNKKFFGQIAPCTAVPEFQGRFEAFLGSSRETLVQRFPFLFDFKFGAQLVTIEMVRSRLPDRAYLLVNRNQLLPVRPEAEAPAPSLRHWEDASPGVLRGQREERLLHLSAASLQCLFSAATRVGASAPLLLSQWGFEWGRVAAFDLETRALERHETPLHGAPLGDTLQLIAEHFQEQGWGGISFDFNLATAGIIVVRIAYSAIFEALRCPPEQRHGFHEGYLRALFSHLASRRLAVRHLPSREDNSSLQYVVLDEARLPTLEQLLSSHEETHDTLLARLARTLPS